jgi:hypothetical protein
MNPIRTAVVALVSTVALGGLAATTAPANADQPTSEPCAAQQTQLDRANAKLADLTAKWQKHPTAANKKAKKAQAQRVAKAQARLDACESEQETPAA